MQITSNTTSMEAGLCVATDKDGRDYCVVVVKGTYAVRKDGQAVLAEEQEPLVYADVHYGKPGETSIKYECDFARFKPRADVVVVGHAYAPRARPVEELRVALECGSIKKEIRVVGDRRWEKKTLGVRPSSPQPFVKMPLVFERAFGGSDHSHKKPERHGTEVRNPIGVGFHRNSDPSVLVDRSLPNLEDPQHPYKKWSDAPQPAGFGVVGRNWQPRIDYAGTYDEEWQKDRFPCLPDDFDDRYFQAAPEDQQVPYLKGGEVVRCSNMTPDEEFVTEVPMVDPPITFRFWDGDVDVQPALDTLVVEPDQTRIILTWRACAPLGRKIHDLANVLIGTQPSSPPPSSKPRFKGISKFIEWKNRAGLK